MAIDEESILKQAYVIRTTNSSLSPKDQQILGIEQTILNYRNGIVEGLNDYVKELLPSRLKDIEDKKNWQPITYLPDFSQEGWEKTVRAIQSQSAGISDELLLVLIGDMITEEALPTYQVLINKPEGMRDISGVQLTPWAIWTRGWTAEENRHGDVLNEYLNYTGRLNMGVVQKTIQYLLARGFDEGAGGDPYKVIIYTSFQERATHISHKRTAQMSREAGDQTLYEICTAIARDESRHESFYKAVMKEIFKLDPNGAMTAYAALMRQNIAMPAQHMYDGTNSNLFDDFSALAQKIGVYTTADYAGIIDHLNSFWKIEQQSVNTVHAQQAQEYVLGLPARYNRIAERTKPQEVDLDRFSWLRT